MSSITTIANDFNCWNCEEPFTEGNVVSTCQKTHKMCKKCALEFYPDSKRLCQAITNQRRGRCPFKKHIQPFDFKARLPLIAPKITIIESKESNESNDGKFYNAQNFKNLSPFNREER